MIARVANARSLRNIFLVFALENRLIRFSENVLDPCAIFNANSFDVRFMKLYKLILIFQSIFCTTPPLLDLKTKLDALEGTTALNLAQNKNLVFNARSLHEYEEEMVIKYDSVDVQCGNDIDCAELTENIKAGNFIAPSNGVYAINVNGIRAPYVRSYMNDPSEFKIMHNEKVVAFYELTVVRVNESMQPVAKSINLILEMKAGDQVNVHLVKYSNPVMLIIKPGYSRILKFYTHFSGNFFSSDKSYEVAE